MAKRFSDRYIKFLKPKEKEYVVRGDKGFALKIRPSGVKTFLFIYQLDGKRKQVNLGNYPDTSLEEANEKYKRARKVLTGNERFAEPEPAPEPDSAPIVTVKEIISKYMALCGQSGGKRWHDIKESAYQNKLQIWHPRPIDSITREEAIALLEEELEIGSGAAANLHKISHTLFEYALERKYIVSNPFYGLKKILPFLKGTKRKRYLKVSEIPIVWYGIINGGGTEVTKRALLMILVTAQRPGEVAAMHRSEIDGDWWTIPIEKTKNKVCEQRVYLTKLAKFLIGDEEGYIFPSPMDDSATGHVIPTTLSQRLTEENHFDLPHFTPHDLRRTVRTHMSRLHIRKEWAEAVLSHVNPGMSGVYDQYEYDDEKKEALLRWEAELLSLVETNIENVAIPKTEGFLAQKRKKECQESGSGKKSRF